jgi:hypothetical protein
MKRVDVNVRTADINETVWDVACAFGCMDWDRCNGHVEPSGSCRRCLDNAKRVIEKLAQLGYVLEK